MPTLYPNNEIRGINPDSEIDLGPNPGGNTPNILSNTNNSLLSRGILFDTFDSPGKTVGGFNVGPGAPTLKAGSGAINVVRDFPWTLTTGIARNEVPTIQLTEYKLTEAAILAAAASWIYAFGGLTADRANTTTNPYFGLYPGTPTNFNYILPYFSDINRGIQNSWDTSDIDLGLPGGGKIFHVEGIETLAKAFTVGVGHEIPKAYTSGSLETIDVNFVLLNTTTIFDVKRNWEFCYLICYQNLQNRRNAILVDPPVFYTLKIPGVKYSPASVITNIRIANLGQTKQLVIDGGTYIIPEAFGISLTFTDLIPQSRNFMDAMRTGKVDLVTVTQDAAGEIRQKLEDTSSKFVAPAVSSGINAGQNAATSIGNILGGG